MTNSNQTADFLFWSICLFGMLGQGIAILSLEGVILYMFLFYSRNIRWVFDIQRSGSSCLSGLAFHDSSAPRALCLWIEQCSFYFLRNFRTPQCVYTCFFFIFLWYIASTNIGGTFFYGLWYGWFILLGFSCTSCCIQSLCSLYIWSLTQHDRDANTCTKFDVWLFQIIKYRQN